MIENPAETPLGSEWDLLTARLQALRTEVGEPSYAEIARRVAELRLAQGQSEHVARVARTTVYDVFRTGRARVNLVLVREIAGVLGASDEQVDAWIAEARESGAPRPTPAPVAQARTDHVTEPAEATVATAATAQPAPRLRLTLALMALCVVVNFVGRALVDFLDLPVHLDMVGTAIAAIALGPWHGVVVGVATNVGAATVSGSDSVPFALVNMTGALLWGYGVRRFGLGRTLPRFLGLNVLVALACTLVAVPLLVLLYGGSTGHSQDQVTSTFLQMTDTLVVAVGMSNMLISLGDKIISGFVALVACSMLPSVLRERTRLVLVSSATEPPGPA